MDNNSNPLGANPGQVGPDLGAVPPTPPAPAPVAGAPVEAVSVTSEPVPMMGAEPVVAAMEVNENKGKKRGLLIGGIVGGALLLIGGIVLVLMLVFRSGIDWQATYDAARDFNRQFTAFSSNADCNNVFRRIADDSVTVSVYERYMSSCQTAINEIRNDVKKMGDQSGVRNDREVQRNWDEFVQAFEDMVKTFEELLPIARDIHRAYSNGNTAEVRRLAEDYQRIADNLDEDAVVDTYNTVMQMIVDKANDNISGGTRGGLNVSDLFSVEG